MSKKNWYDQINITYVLIALIIGGSIIGYGYLNAESKKSELELKKNTLLIEYQNQKVKEEKYNDCITQASQNNQEWWERTCEAKKLGENCLLPNNVADEINNSLDKEKNRCVELYK